MELINEQTTHQALKEAFQQYKETSTKELDQVKQNLSSQLDRERKGWASIAAEKETLIENLRKQYEVRFIFLR
jgi:hypothetical protein